MNLGYTCETEFCETRVLLETALLALVLHDLVSDKRELLPGCVELQNAIDVLFNHCGYANIEFLRLIRD